MPEGDGLLAGVTVVAIEQAVSAPLCTRTLADFGARVIKIENPEGGDFARSFDGVVHGLSAHFVWLAHGKESVTLNLKHPDGMRVLHRILARADVLVSNLAPGVMTRLGIGKNALRQSHPHLISLEITGYGSTGPLAHKRAYDLLVQAEAGACAITGWKGAPAKPGPPMADACTGLYAAITVLAGLHARGRSGQAVSGSVSMFDAMAELMSFALNYARYTGEDQLPVGMGSPAVAPYGAYETADGQIVVLGTTNDSEWARLAAMLGRRDLACDVRYRTNSERVAARESLDSVIGGWCRERTLEQVQRLADDAGIGNARYNTPREVLEHEQLTTRGRWHEVESPVGAVTVLKPPPVVPGYPPVMGPIPSLGEHTDAVLFELGLTESDISELRKARAI